MGDGALSEAGWEPEATVSVLWGPMWSLQILKPGNWRLNNFLCGLHLGEAF